MASIKQLPARLDLECVAGDPFALLIAGTGITTFASAELTMTSAAGDAYTTNPGIGDATALDDEITLTWTAADTAALNTATRPKAYRYSVSATVDGLGPYELIAGTFSVHPVGASSSTSSTGTANLSVSVGTATAALDITLAGALVSDDYELRILRPDDEVPDPIPTGTLRLVETGEPASPGAPTGLTGTPSDQQMALTWTAPTVDGGTSITDYVVQYKLAVASTWTTFTDGVSTSTSATVTGLTNLSSYNFRVAAKNSVGTGAYGASFTGTPENIIYPPSQITDLAGTAGDTQVVLTWTAPAANGASITDYVVQYKLTSSGTWLTFSDGTSASTGATVTGLTNSSSYDFRVAAVNSAGTGTYSDTSTATPYAIPNIQLVSGSKKTATLTPGSRANTLSLTLQTPTAGNLLVLACATVDWDSTGTCAITGPVGWTEVTPPTTVGTNAKDVAIFYKIATGSETTVTCTTANNVGIGLWASEFSGINSSTPFDVKGNTAHSATNPATVTASGTTATNKSLWVVARVDPSNGSTTWTNSLVEDYRNSYDIAVAYRITTSAATPSTQLTLGSNTQGWMMIAAFRGGA